MQNKVAAILAHNPFVLPKDSSLVRHTMVEMAYYIKSLEDQLASTRSPSDSVQEFASGEDYDSDDQAVAEHMQRLTLEQSECSYSGRSGALTPAKTIAQLKRRYMGLTGPIVTHRRPEYCTMHPVSLPPILCLLHVHFLSGIGWIHRCHSYFLSRI